MKCSVLKILPSGLAVLLFITGCITEPDFGPSVHSVEFSIKNNLPCFAPRDDSTLARSNARIFTIYVMQIVENAGSKEDVTFPWMVRWQDPVRLAQGECIQYGVDTGHKLYALPLEDCTDPHPKPVHGGSKLLASGECVVDDEAKKLEKGVTYFVAMEAQTDDSKKGEGHYIRNFFCLTDGKNGETIVHRLKLNMSRTSVETCP